MREADRINYLVIGIGLNVNQEEQDFPPVIKDTAISLAMVTGHLWQRAEILCHILYEFEKEYLSYLSKGFSQTLLQWRELNITLGKEVIVSTKEETYTGIAEDINEHGCLLVRKNTGEVVTLWAGEMFL